MRLQRQFASAVAAVLTMGVAAAAHAQTPPVDPGRLDERLRPPVERPDVSPIEVPTLPQQEAGPESNLAVELSAVRFEGATAVPVEVLNAIAAPYIGRRMPLSEVFRLAEEVTAEYRRRGYVLSRAIVGPQRIENGVLTLQILEGHVDQIRIEGDAGGYERFLQSYVEPVRASRPTAADDLSRALLLARDLRGVDVRAVVTPSATVPAAADLNLVVERDPVEAFVGVDNRGSRRLGPIQLFGAVALNDTFGWGERIALSAVVAPEDGELGFISASYDQPIGGSGLRFNAFASYAVTEPGDELAVFGLEGESTTWGLGLEYPFRRSRATNIIGRTVFTSRDSSSWNDLIDPIFEDEIRTLSAELFVNHADSWRGFTSGRLAVTHGLDAFGATADSDPNKSRATGTANFTRFNVEVSRLQPLAGGLSLELAAAAQITSDSLLASEEFGLGGTHFGRAFDPSEITGDEGFAARAEFFYTLPAQQFGTLEPYVYYEGGQVRQNDPLPGEPRRDSLRAAGLGLRVAFNDRLSASVEYAKPLIRDVAAEGDRDGRVFFSLSAAF